MRSSKKRKLAGIPTKPVNVILPVEVYDKLSQIAGPRSFGETVERLVIREHSKRLKKFESLQVERNILLIP